MNPFDIVKLEISTAGSVNFDINAGRLLIDGLLQLENPKISSDVADYFDEDCNFVEFIDRITLVDDTIADDRLLLQDFLQLQPQSRQQDMENAWKAMDMTTNFTQSSKRLLREKEQVFVKCIASFFHSSSQGSLYHFRQLFVAGLNFCPNFVHHLCNETNAAGIQIFKLLLWYMLLI